jgi:outer membrane protein TolC
MKIKTLGINLKKTGVTVGIFFSIISVSQAQQLEHLTLEQAQQLAEQNYPLIRQRDLIKQTSGLTLSNLNKGYLPQLSINGQASYQSDVTTIQSPVPGVEFIPPTKDQYKITADVNQVLFDGGTIRQQKNIQVLNTQVETQKVEVELYKLKDRINQLYLGILLQHENLKQAALKQNDLEVAVRKVEAQVRNGLIFKSNLYALQAELLQVKERVIEVKASRDGLLRTLGLFLNQTLNEFSILETPTPGAISFDPEIKRPELGLYTYQSNLLLQQNSLVRSRNLPKFSLFAQGGYGRPGLNVLLNEFDWFYIGGVRLNWNISGYYTYHNDKQITDLNRQQIETNRATFLLNTNTVLSQQQTDIEKMQQLVQTDEKIIELCTKVKNAALAQLENGVITTNDFLLNVNDENEARLLKIFHQLQLLQAQINYRTTAGE